MSSRRDRNTKMVGYTGNTDSSKTAHWHTIMDLDFKSMTAGSLAENQGSLTGLDGHEYHCRRGNSAFDANMTNGTGLVTSFATSSTQQNRIAFKIKNFPRLTDGSSYLAAGSNVTITSASNGQVTIAASGGSGSPGVSNTQVQYNN